MQQQQYNFFSQASWGRLEMKSERKVQVSGTLIVSLRALLSKIISLEIFQFLRSLTRKTKTINNLEWREYPIVKVMKEIIVYVQRQKASKENYTYSNYMQ